MPAGDADAGDDSLPWNARMARTIWENMVRYQDLVPETLRFLLQTCFELAKEEGRSEETFRRIVQFALVTHGLEPAINNPYGSGILENCKVPSCFYKMSQILVVLEALIKGQPLPKANKYPAINDLINNSQ